MPGSSSLRVVSLADDKSAASFSELLRQLRLEVFKNRRKRVVVDLHRLENISAGPALMLVSEIKRCSAYSKGRATVTGTYPKSERSREILVKSGFFQAIGVKDPALPESIENRTYVKIEQRSQMEPELAYRLIECFNEMSALSKAERKTLYLAALECMDNVREHAYSLESKTPYLYKEWWLAGYANHETGDIAFIFYDQGRGIPKTIQRRKHQRVVDKLSHWSDADWIQRATRRRESRHPSKRRGHGLKRLKIFGTTTNKSGFLKVISNRGFFALGNDGGVKKSSLNTPLEGSYVEWFLRSYNHRKEQGIGD